MATEKKEVKFKVFSIVRDLTDTDKCPPQAKVIVAILKGLGGSSEREPLIAALKAPDVLKTNQTVDRIFGFYRPKLMAMGVLKEETKTKIIEVEVPDKPAPAEKAAAAEKTEGGTTAPAAQKTDSKKKATKAE